MKNVKVIEQMLITLQYVNTFKYESTSLSNSPQFPKEHYFLESSQVLPMCPGKNNV